MSKRIIIAGGGTGGHIFPAIAIANALKQMDAEIEILFVGAKGKMEMEKVPQAGYSIEGLDITGLNRSSLIKNIGLPLKLVKSFFQVRSIFKKFKPDAAIGVGGYSSFPVLRYAQAKGIKLLFMSQILCRQIQYHTGEEGHQNFYGYRWYGEIFSGSKNYGNR
jgi:UDP-N-acetylglucosamine--N-acetylmuramyl-(pentapeptide) pyrophosphoryl-undecaprenol N-acetylglucosamine transferase